MGVALINGQRTWTLRRDHEGHREYKIKHLVACSRLDGPANAIQCPGLPVPGTIWLFDSDIDVYAYCKQEASVTPLTTNEPNEWFEVEQTFSTKPDGKACREEQFDDPLLQPQKVSGSTTKATVEATEDRNGAPLVNSAWEKITGKNVEFDASRDVITIEQNVADLEYALVHSMMNTVNEFTLWGFPPRCVKLSSFRWTRQYQGTCQVYYTRTFEFEINEDTWDRDVLDEGTKALNGHWEGKAWVLDNIVNEDGVDLGPPDPAYPSDFIRVQDKNGNLMKVVLNGHGVPYDPEGATSGTADDVPGVTHIEYYQESDFLLLGIPLFF